MHTNLKVESKFGKWLDPRHGISETTAAFNFKIIFQHGLPHFGGLTMRLQNTGQIQTVNIVRNPQKLPNEVKFITEHWGGKRQDLFNIKA
jgi:hypothetical protein